MALTTAEKNRRKRERKKRERAEEKRRLEEAERKTSIETEDGGDGGGEGQEEEEEEEVEIEYVAAPLVLEGPHSARAYGVPSASTPATAVGGDEETKSEDAGDDIAAVMRRFQSRAAVVVSEDEGGSGGSAAARGEAEPKPPKRRDFRSDSDDDDNSDDPDSDSDSSDQPRLSRRKLRELSRPSVAELKNRVDRPDLVEAHDVTAADPNFLVYLKGVAGTVPVPRHWGRKRKYLQGKRGIEKPPFRLPDFIVKTGICDVRSAVAEDEAKMSAKQKNRSRVAPRSGGVDVDYRTLHDAFFVHQTKLRGMTAFGDLYYEGKEFETARASGVKVGHLSDRLKAALGMTEGSPPPWLINMQRYGPPPSYPNATIPGLNAPIPEGASYGYHLGGWGAPPVDAFKRPLYGGNPFDRPAPSGAGGADDAFGADGAGALVTSDGKALGKKAWGALPTALNEGESSEEEEDEEEEGSEEEESSGEEMESESEDDDDEEEDGGEGDKKGEGKDADADPQTGTESVLPPDGAESVVPASALDLRKRTDDGTAGDETPSQQPRQLYTVLRQTEADREAQANAVFKSNVAYALPGSAAASGGDAVGGAESVLAKAPMETGKRKRGGGNGKGDEEDDDDLGKKFKF